MHFRIPLWMILGVAVSLMPVGLLWAQMDRPVLPPTASDSTIGDEGRPAGSDAPASDAVFAPNWDDLAPAGRDRSEETTSPEPKASAEPASPAESTVPTERSGPAAPIGLPAAADSQESSEAVSSARLRFNFRFQPWSEVLNWFADQAGYSLVLDVAPTGTFNYSDARQYTPAEAIDLLNSVLVTKGYTLVLRDRMLMLVNLEDTIPPSLISEVPPAELEGRGVFELLSTRFQLKNLSVEDAQDEIEELIGPQGSMIPLPKAQQLVVRETGGRLRTIRDVLEQAERSRDPALHELRWFELHSVSPDEVVALMRQMFDIPEDSNAMSDGSLRFATDPAGLRLLAAGKPERLEQVAKMLQTIDQAAFGDAMPSGPQAAPQIEVYSVAPADPESALQVMQTLLAESPGARLSLDPKTNNLIAMARPAEHATIRATLDQMQRDAQDIEVIRLRTVDPHLAVLAINKLFTEEGAKPPTVDADLVNRQLLIRGNAEQIAQIRSLLEKMGESRDSAGVLSGGKLRRISLEGNVGELLDRLKQLWPSLQENDLRIITADGAAGDWIDERTPVPSPADERTEPMSRTESAEPGGWRSRGGSTGRGGSMGRGGLIGGGRPMQAGTLREEESPREIAERLPDVGREAVSDPAVDRELPAETAVEPEEFDLAVGERSEPGKSATAIPVPDIRPPRLPEAALPPSLPAVPEEPLEAMRPPEEPSAMPLDLPPDASPGAPVLPPLPAGAPDAQEPLAPSNDAEVSGEEAPVFAIPGRDGIVISSEDTEALDRLETLVGVLAGGAAAGQSKLTVFYLRHTQATTAAERLNQLLASSGSVSVSTSSTTAAAVTPGQPSRSNGRTDAKPAEPPKTQPSGIFGTYGGASSAGHITLAGPVSITPDARLNALLVQALPADVKTIERLLTILDRPGSPEEVAADSKARLIPVVHTTASEIAKVVKEVFEDRLTSTSNRRSPQQMMMQMMRRGRGMPGMPGMPGAMVDLGQSTEPEQKMSIGVDERTNSVVVAAPEPLFEEVRQLVLTLDQAASEENQTVQVLSLRNSNPETVQAALSTVFGDLVQSSGTSNSRSSSTSRTGTSSRRGPTGSFSQFPYSFMMRPGGSSRSRTGSRR